MDKKLRYTVIFEEAPEGGYVARIPALGCTTEGETFEEARDMAEDAIKCYCESLLKHGEPIPEEGQNELVGSISISLPLSTP